MAKDAVSYNSPYYDELASNTEQKLELPVGLLSSIVKRGERSNADQVSSAGAKSVFQIIPATRDSALKKYGIDAYLSPENAAEVAGLLLKEGISRNKGDVSAAVSEYHGGVNRDNWGPLTKAYTNRVMTGQQASKIDALSAGFAKFMADNPAKGATHSAAPTEQKPDALAQGFGQWLDSGATQKPQQDQTSSDQSTSSAPRSGFDQVTRQLGLTARYGIEGATAGAGMVTDPVIQAIGGAVRAATGSNYDPATLASVGRGISNSMGLPNPETSGERIVGAVTRGMAGASGGIAAASQVAGATQGITQNVAQQMASQAGTQVAAGAAAGGAGQAVAENGGGTGAQIAAALAAGIATPAAMAGASKVASLGRGTIAPEQQAIIDAGEASGVPVMTSDVLPPKTFVGRQAQAVGERVPLAGTGAIRQGQQEARQSAVTKIAAEYGTPSYETMVASLKGKVGNIKKAAGNVIDKTGQQLDAVGPVTPTKSIQAIDDAVAKLNKPNVYNPDKASQVDDLMGLRDVLAGGQQTFTSLRQSRTALREVMDSVDPAGRSQLPSYAKKLVTGVYSAMKSDMDDFALANLPQARFDKLIRANQVYGDEVQLLKASRLKNVLDKGDMTPEVVRNMIYSNKPSENRILYDSLGTAGRNQVKAALIDDAANKALRNGDINPNAFGAELAKHDKKLDVFFKGDEREAISGLVRLMQVTRRAQSAADAPTTTGATLLPYAAGAAALADFGATLTAAVTAGSLARIYESPGVRDLLLKLANTSAQSAAESRYVTSLVSAVRSANQQQEKNKPKPTPVDKKTGAKPLAF
jgi:hypothetical protein